jgi:hypothetical protein
MDIVVMYDRNQEESAGWQWSEGKDGSGREWFAQAISTCPGETRVKGDWEASHKSLQIFASNIRFDANNVPQHSSHRVFSENHNLLIENLDATRIRCKMNFWNFGFQPRHEGGKQRSSRES